MSPSRIERSSLPAGLPGPVVWLALVGACAGEAATAAQAVFEANAGLGPGLAAAGCTLGLCLVVGLPLGLGARLLLGNRSTGALFQGLREASGGPAAGLGAALGAAALGALAATRLGPRFGAAMSPRFATLATALCALCVFMAALMGSLPAVRQGARASGALATRLPARWVGLVRWSALFAVITVASVCLGRLLGSEWVPAPLGAIVGAVIGARLPVRTPSWPRRVRAAGSWLLAWGLACAAPVALDAAPSPAQRAILYRAPYAGLLIGIGRAQLDEDGDGYARALLGGDCDDTNAAINPAAHDTAGDGVDQNCSGADAAVYSAPPEPRSELPRDWPRRPNMVLILIDALRPDHLSANGYGRPTTPNLDRFARDAVVFDRAYSPAPSTRFAMASLFTGRDARRLPHTDRGGNEFDLLPAAHTLAEQLPGYDKVGYSISYVLQHNRGTGQGFRTWETPWPVTEWASAYGRAADLTTDAATTYLEGAPTTRPYLLFLHYRCTHDPFIAHDRWPYGDAAVDRYDSALSYCDDRLGHLLDTLRARDDWDRTALFIFSDHGELFGEHGIHSHGNSLYEPDVRIVLMAHTPSAPAGHVETPVQLTDVAPTLLEFAGRTVPGGLDGRSLAPLLFDPARRREPGRPLFMFTKLVRGSVHYDAEAVVRWPLKLIRDHRTGDEELFDLARDPQEARNLRSARSAEASSLSELLDSYSSFRGGPDRALPPIRRPAAVLRAPAPTPNTER